MSRQAWCNQMGSWAESQGCMPGAGDFGDRLGLEDQERHLAAVRQIIIVELLQKVCAFYDSTPASFLKQSLEYIRSGILHPDWQTLLQNPDWQQFAAAPQSNGHAHGPLQDVSAFQAPFKGYSPFSELVNALPLRTPPVEVVKSTLPRHSPYIGFHRHSPSSNLFCRRARTCATPPRVCSPSGSTNKMDRLAKPNDAPPSPKDTKALTKAKKQVLHRSNTVNSFLEPSSASLAPSFSCTEQSIVPSHGCGDTLAPSRTDAFMGPLLSRSLNGMTSQLGLAQSISRNLSIFERDFIYIRTLGKGAFGVVYEVQNKLDLKNYAMKVVMFNTNDAEVKNKALREVQSWSHARHPHVCRYSHAWVESGWAMQYPFFSSDDGDAPITVRENECSEPLSPPIEDSPEFSGSKPASINRSASRPNCLQEETLIDSVDSNDDIIFADSSDEPDKSVQTKSVTFNRSRKTRGGRSTKALSFPQTLFIQMELCESTLEQWVRAQSETRVCPHNTCKVQMAKQVTTALTNFGQLLSALEHIHGMDLVHRDVKPSNIYRTNGGCWVLGDFGLSKSIHESASSEGPQWTSMDSGTVGTRAYSAPEQINGCDVNAAADMFSSGLVLLELLLLFSTMHERAQAFCSVRISRKVPDTIVMKYFPKIAELILALTSSNPADRPTAESLLHSRSLWRYEVTQELKKFCVDIDFAAQDVWCISTPMFRPSSPPLLPLDDEGLSPLDPVSEQACQTECILVECAVQTD